MQPLKFLVVDDATFIRDMLKKQLRDAFPGAAIVDVPNAMRAQVALKSERFNLVLCDWEMPEMSGEEFLRWLRAHPQHRELPFIMVSSRGERDFVMKAVQAGVNDYIGKPFKPEILIAKVSRALSRAGHDVAAARHASGGGGLTQGIAGASVAVLTGKAESKPAAPARRSSNVKGQAEIAFAGHTSTCVISDITLQRLSGIMRREERLPAILEPVVVSIITGEAEAREVARLNGYVHALQAGENRIDANVLKLVIRFVDDDPTKLELLSHYISSL